MLLRSMVLGLALASAVGFASSCSKSGGESHSARPAASSTRQTAISTPAPKPTPTAVRTNDPNEPRTVRPSSQQPPPCAGTTFTPCGGSLVGTWKFSADCVDLPPKFAAGPAGSNDPTGGSCPSATGGIVIELSGTITFQADKTYTLDAAAQQAIAEFTVPKTCLSAGKTCADLEESAVDAGKSCKIRHTEDGTPRSETGTYAVDATNNAVTTRKTGAGTSAGSGSDDSEGEAMLAPGKPNPYCVSGTTAKIKNVDDHGSTIVLLLKKQ